MDDFMEIGSLGQIYNKQDILDHLPKENGITWEMENFQTKELGENFVLATYQVKKISNETTIVSLRSSIWQKENGDWKMLFHQGTLLN